MGLTVSERVRGRAKEDNHIIIFDRALVIGS